MIKEASVAGTFYPAIPNQLKKSISSVLLKAESFDLQIPMMIVPHAGYIYSGEIAASAFKGLEGLKINSALLIGPSHHHYFKGVACSSAQGFSTPLGLIPVDENFRSKLNKFDFIKINDDAFNSEHCLEVQLPFLQYLFPELAVTLLLAGDCDAQEISAIIEEAAIDPYTAIIISSDLSHFNSYKNAQLIDLETIKHIESLNWQSLGGEDACGFKGIGGLTHYLKSKNLELKCIDYRNSGDTAGDKNRVVGYASFYACTDAKDIYSKQERQKLLQLARWSIANELGINYTAPLDLPCGSDALGASFVTINKNGQLRGCIGSLSAHRSLQQDIIKNASAAAFKDPRFPQLTASEFDDLEISISILSAPKQINVEDECNLIEKLRPGIDGLILEDQNHYSTFLPSVWEQLPSPHDFLKQLKIKAGLSAHHWSDSIKFSTYTTNYFSEN